MSSISKQNNFQTSPYPVRKKKRNNVKLTWNKYSSVKDSDAEQIDAFVADIIAKASDDYLKECQEHKTEERTTFTELWKLGEKAWSYMDDDIPGMMENDRLLQLSSDVDCREVGDYKGSSNVINSTSTRQSNVDDEGRRQRHRNLRMAFRRILLQFACCHRDCFKNMYELT